MPITRRLALILALAGASAASGVAVAAAPRTVVDDLGRSVSVPAPPLRIVSLSPAATEMLFAAGAGATRIGDAAMIDMERLVALRPDVVVAWPSGGNPAQQARIATLGVPLYEQQLEHLADLPAAIRRLGALASTQTAAEHAADELAVRLAALERTYGGGAGRDAPRPSVLLQGWNRPIYTVGGRHLMSDAVRICGARNVFADLPEAGPVVDIEAVIARNPDIILVLAPPGEGAAWAADWRRFPNSAAVTAQRVVSFEDQALSRLGPSVVGATEKLCRALARVSRGSY